MTVIILFTYFLTDFCLRLLLPSCSLLVLGAQTGAQGKWDFYFVYIGNFGQKSLLTIPMTDRILLGVHLATDQLRRVFACTFHFSFQYFYYGIFQQTLNFGDVRILHFGRSFLRHTLLIAAALLYSLATLIYIDYHQVFTSHCKNN